MSTSVQQDYGPFNTPTSFPVILPMLGNPWAIAGIATFLYLKNNSTFTGLCAAFKNEAFGLIGLGQRQEFGIKDEPGVENED